MYNSDIPTLQCNQLIIGDMLTFVTSTQVCEKVPKATHVWFGSYDDSDIHKRYRDIVNYCKCRSIDGIITNILTQRLGKQRVSNQTDASEEKLMLSAKSIGIEQNDAERSNSNPEGHLNSNGIVNAEAKRINHVIEEQSHIDFTMKDTSSNSCSNTCLETPNIGKQRESNLPIKDILETMQEMSPSSFGVLESTKADKFSSESGSSHNYKHNHLVKSFNLTPQSPYERNLCEMNGELYDTYFPKSVKQEVIDSVIPLFDESVRQILQTSLLTVLHRHGFNETFTRMLTDETISVFEKNVRESLSGESLQGGFQSVNLSHIVQGTSQYNINSIPSCSVISVDNIDCHSTMRHKEEESAATLAVDNIDCHSTMRHKEEENAATLTQNKKESVDHIFTKPFFTSVKVSAIGGSMDAKSLLKNKIITFRKMMEIALNEQYCNNNYKVHHDKTNLKVEERVSLVEIVKDFLTLQNSYDLKLLEYKSQKKIKCITQGTQTVSTGNVLFIKVLSSNV